MGTGVSFSLSPPHFLFSSEVLSYDLLLLTQKPIEDSQQLRSLKTGYCKRNLLFDSCVSPFIWLSPRPISISPLHTSLYFHFLTYLPDHLSGVLLAEAMGNLISRGASRLDAFSVYPFPHSYPAMLLAEQLVHQRCVHPGPLVLRTAPLKFPTPATDRDRTVSRRSEPSSRTALMGEQPNPWDRLQPQDAMSRHRGAKPPRRCGLLGR